jgi:hypothetical protein
MADMMGTVLSTLIVLVIIFVLAGINDSKSRNKKSNLPPPENPPEPEIPTDAFTRRNLDQDMSPEMEKYIKEREEIKG